MNDDFSKSQLLNIFFGRKWNDSLLVCDRVSVVSETRINNVQFYTEALVVAQKIFIQIET